MKAPEGVDDWLVVGPAETKTELVDHVRDKGPKPLLDALLGVEAMDHPSDAELQAFGLKRLRGHDRMTGPRPDLCDGAGRLATSLLRGPPAQDVLGGRGLDLLAEALAVEGEQGVVRRIARAA